MVIRRFTDVFFLAAFSLVFACSTHHRPHQQWSDVAGTFYVVKKGETLHRIAQKYRTSANELMEINGLESPQSLRDGQILYIPEPQSYSSKKPSKIAAAPQKAKISPLDLITESKEQDSPTVRNPVFAWPVPSGVVFRTFDTSPTNLHEGISIGAPPTTAVQAAGPGEVMYVGNEGTSYGLMIIIRHEEPFVTVYGNLESASVEKGQRVKKGDTIGVVGISGDVESPRVHFQVRKNRKPVDPELYLPY